MGGQDIDCGHSAGQLRHDVLNGQPRTPDDGLSQHHLRIDLDAIVFHGGHPIFDAILALPSQRTKL
jgi:hypothetical protein